jgi:hypothetical protein
LGRYLEIGSDQGRIAKPRNHSPTRPPSVLVLLLFLVLEIESENEEEAL